MRIDEDPAAQEPTGKTAELPAVAEHRRWWHRAPRGTKGEVFAGAATALVVTITAAALTVSLHTGSGAIVPDAPSAVSDPTTAPATVPGIPPGGPHPWRGGILGLVPTARASWHVSLPTHAAGGASITAPAPPRTGTPAPPTTPASSAPPVPSSPAPPPATSTTPAPEGSPT